MKHKEVFTLPNAKLCLKKKIPLEEILCHRISNLPQNFIIHTLARNYIPTLLNLAMKEELKYSPSNS